MSPTIKRGPTPSSRPRKVANSRLLLLVPSTSYRAGDYLAAAAELGVSVVVGSDHHQVLSDAAPGRSLEVDFEDLEAGPRAIAAYAQQYPLDAVIGTDDESAEFAAVTAKTLGLPHNAPDGVRAARDKSMFRAVTKRAGLAAPRHALTMSVDQTVRAAKRIGFPCVLKPTHRSGSQGVLRVNNPDQCEAGAVRIFKLLARGGPDPGKHRLLVESYIDGDELALDGLLLGGQLHTLALFDKPDPMAGPYFEETLLVTPSRADPEVQAQAIEAVGAAARALGLTWGPIHAEVRVPQSAAGDRGHTRSLGGGITSRPSPTLLELAPRTVGGLCGRSLDFEHGWTLESLVIAAALGKLSAPPPLRSNASGVMMIPIPRSGVLHGIDGIVQARRVCGVTGVVLSIACGEVVEALPEGNRYLGFIFARRRTPEEVETALRAAHRALRIDIR